MESILKIKKGEENLSQFDISITGVDEPISDIRLAFNKNNYTISYNGQYNNKTASFKIFGDDILSGVDKFKLEVFIKDRYYVPLEGGVEIENPILISANLKSNESGGLEVKASMKNEELNKKYKPEVRAKIFPVEKINRKYITLNGDKVIVNG